MEAFKNPKFSFVEAVLNDYDELVLKNLKVDISYSDDVYDYNFFTKKNGVKIDILTHDLKQWQLSIKDPTEREDYLVFLDCK